MLGGAPRNKIRTIINQIQRVRIQRTSSGIFRDNMILFGVLVMTFYLGVQLMIQLRSVIEPFLWAVVMSIALMPVVDFVQHLCQNVFHMIPNNF